jgi:NodT family efflux transporter outer membrane factor (OMF) lipoprotein
MLIVTPLKVVYYFCVLFLLSACASSGTKLETSPKISAQSVGLTKEQSTVLVVQDWWKSLGDAQLNDLVELALKGQPTIAAVKARMNRMLAMADLARASVLPQGNVNATATRQRFTANGIYPLPIAGNTYNMGEVQLGLSWSPDLFGMHAAEWAAAMGQVHAARADTAAAAVSLAAQVSRSYITLGRLLVWRELADQAVLQQDTALQLVRSRAEAGLDTQIDQRQSDALLLDARSQREALDEQIVIARHQLATLCGMNPQALDQLRPNLAKLSLQEMPLDLGADLLGRRADIVAARWRVEAATQDIKVAEKHFYPNVTLGAFVGLNAIDLNKVFNGASKETAIAPAVRLPLFDGGFLRAQLRGREGEAELAVANYNSVVLEAVKQASDAISSSQSLQRQEVEQEKSLQVAQQAYDLTRQRFEAGLVNKLVLLNALSQLLSQQRLSADVRARSLSNRIFLLTALGGGWSETSN